MAEAAVEVFMEAAVFTAAEAVDTSVVVDTQISVVAGVLPYVRVEWRPDHFQGLAAAP